MWRQPFNEFLLTLNWLFGFIYYHVNLFDVNSLSKRDQLLKHQLLFKIRCIADFCWPDNILTSTDCRPDCRPDCRQNYVTFWNESAHSWKSWKCVFHYNFAVFAALMQEVIGLRAFQASRLAHYSKHPFFCTKFNSILKVQFQVQI